jgi:diaminopimelate decarboxylase
MSIPPSLALPFTEAEIRKSIAFNGNTTPFHLYSERVIIDTARRLNQVFAEHELPFKNHFAVKALPNPHILEILRKE